MRALCRLAYDDRSGAREVHRVISKVVIKGVIYLLSPDFEDKSVVITSSVDDVSDATRDELFESFVYEVE
jgi:hypothetical protein